MALLTTQDPYRRVLEKVARALDETSSPPSGALAHRPAPPVQAKVETPLLAATAAAAGASSSEYGDQRYADAYAWALGEGLVEDGDDGTLIVRGRRIRGGSLQQASDYLNGRMHGNVDFPGRNDLRAMLHDSYSRHKTPGKLPFRANKKQKAVATLVQKQTRKRLDAWIDSLSDGQVRELSSVLQRRSEA